ncbi:MAG: hypothetical protein Q4G39_00435 [Brachymonas sp.]|nr:hypothetical protein [Brachymonas sp.]
MKDVIAWLWLMPASALIAGACTWLFTRNEDAPENTRLLAVFMGTFVLAVAGFSLVNVNFPGGRGFDTVAQKVPSVAALKQYDPQAYEVLKTEFEQGVKRGTRQEELVVHMQARMGELMRERLPRASNASVVAYFTPVVTAMEAIHAKDPEACLQILGGVNTRALSRNVSSDLQLKTDDALAEVIKSAATNPQSPPDQQEVQALMAGISKKVMQRHTSAIAQVMERGGSPSSSKELMCSITLDTMHEVLTLPEEQAGMLLRGMNSAN